MKIWIAIVLGIIQGITEFLPISSSGHLILAEQLLGVQTSEFFVLLMHVATLIAVVLFFWKEILWCLKNPLSKNTQYILISTLCTCAIALPMKKYINPTIALGPCFLASGAVLLFGELITRKTKAKKQLSYGKSIAIGVVQGFCILPGLSRLGLTTSTLKLSGTSSKDATTYSFLISIPAVVGGLILEIAKGKPFALATNIWACLIGFLFALLFACLSLFLLKYLMKKNCWWVFAPYLIVLGTVVTILQYA